MDLLSALRSFARPLFSADVNHLSHQPPAMIECLEHRRLLSGTIATDSSPSSGSGSTLNVANDATVTGSVTDSNGVALANAFVRLSAVVSSTGTTTPSIPQGPQGPHDLFVQTNSSGDYSFSKLAAGTYVVTAFDKGYVRSTSASFTVAADATAAAPTLALTAEVFGTVTGTITDSNGNDLANAWVEICPAPTTSGTPTSDASSTNPPPPGPFSTPQFVQTNSSGQYTFDNVLAGSYVVTARAKGYFHNNSAAFTVGSGTTTAPAVALTAIANGTVSGAVTDSGGTALDDVRVILSSTTAGAPGAVQVAMTDSSGDYSFTNVPTGTYTVTAHDRGYSTTASADFTVATGANTAPTIALTALTYGNVTGEVTDSTGDPLDNAWVELVLASEVESSTVGGAPVGIGGPGQGPHQPGMILFAQTDSSGDYTFSNVVTGSYDVIVRDFSYKRGTSADFTVATGNNTAPTVALTAAPAPTGSGPDVLLA
jgi:large repetitive protein